MSDSRETVADRLERAADRMFNAGLLDEERSYRDAAARVRGGLSLEETHALEQELLTSQKPRLVNRLTALAAQGEYDGGGGSEGEGSTVSATGEAADEPVLTEIESGASQLLSSAPSTGISNPFSSAQSGWISSTEPVNPYTAVAGAGSDDGSAYTNGQSIDSYSGVAPVGDNPNSYTTGQNINPITGDQNTDPFSPSPSGSMLSSPYLLAANDVPANANIASDAGGPDYGQPGASASAAPGGLTWTGFTTDYSGTNYLTYVTSDGTTLWYNPDTGSFSNPQVDIQGTIYPPGTPVPLPPDFVPEDSEDTTPVPTTTNTQSAAAPAPPPIDAPLTPAQEAQLNAAIQQAVEASGPGPLDAGQPTNINDVIAGTDLAPGGPTAAQPPDQPGSPPAAPLSQPVAQTTEQIDEENWGAAKSGMWDAFVDLGQGLLTLSWNSNPAFAALSAFGIKPSLDWAKSGPPAPTGNPIRDAQLLDNYQSGAWVTRVVAIAAPIGGEGILDAALSGATDITSLEGFGTGGGGIGGGGGWSTFDAEWDATFSERWADGGASAFEQAARDNAAATGGFVPSWAIAPESQLGWSGADLALSGMSAEESQLVEDVLNAPGVLVGRSSAIGGEGQFTLDNWLLTKDIEWTQRWQDVYDKALYLRTAGGTPVNVMAGAGYTLGEVTAAEAGASTSGVFNFPYWPD